MVDWIESGEENSFSDWNQYSSGGFKKNSIITYLWNKTLPNNKIRFEIQFPDSKLEDILPYICVPEKRLEIDYEALASVLKAKEYGMDSALVYTVMKTIWPIGARDVLLNAQFVQHEGKAWLIQNSTEDEDFPVGKLLRVKIPFMIYFVRPNPTINGHTMIHISEFNFGGSIP